MGMPGRSVPAGRPRQGARVPLWRWAARAREEIGGAIFRGRLPFSSSSSPSPSYRWFSFTEHVPLLAKCILASVRAQH
eukprot:4720999-Pyramimonas_sp.AAC.1